MTDVLWVLIYVGLFYFMMRFGCGGHMGHRRHRADSTHSHAEDHSGNPGMSTVKDPVCGMTVSTDDGYGRTYRGREYRFCSKTCFDRFENDPERYAEEERLAS